MATAATSLTTDEAELPGLITAVRPGAKPRLVATNPDTAWVPALRPFPAAAPRRREPLPRGSLCAADVTAAGLAMLLVLALLGDSRVGLVTLGSTLLIGLLFKAAGLYDREQVRLVRSTLDEAPLLLQLTGLYALALAILQPFLIDRLDLTGARIAELWAASFIAVLAARLLVRWFTRQTSAAEQCLVVGDSRAATRIGEKLRSSRAHAVVAAVVPVRELEHLDGPDDMRGIVSDLNVDRIIIAPSSNDPAPQAELVRLAKATGVPVNLLPPIFEAVGSAVEFESVDGLTMLGVRPFGLSRPSRLLKRGFDLLGTSIGLLFAAPLIAAIAVAIRIDSPGPILFRQVRVGRDGRTFPILKFRSMVADAEAQKDRLRRFNEVGDGMFKMTADPRVTRVGRLLRATSLDELPQLFNVLRGEMSLVGPRPLVADEDALVTGTDRSRLHLTPGMTGPWQVLGSRVPMQEMVGLDYLYVANWSLWADIRVLLHTVRHVLRRGNV